MAAGYPAKVICFPPEPVEVDLRFRRGLRLRRPVPQLRQGHREQLGDGLPEQDEAVRLPVEPQPAARGARLPVTAAGKGGPALALEIALAEIGRDPLEGLALFPADPVLKGDDVLRAIEELLKLFLRYALQRFAGVDPIEVRGGLDKALRDRGMRQPLFCQKPDAALENRALHILDQRLPADRDHGPASAAAAAGPAALLIGRGEGEPGAGNAGKDPPA